MNIVMKKYRYEGFTLLELIIVVAIISILAVAGFAAFRGFQQKARDTKRQSDVRQIASAYEVKYDSDLQSYPVLVPNDFRAGVVPTPPEGGSYIGILTSPATGFWVCAALEANTLTCNATSATCFCFPSVHNTPPVGTLH